MVLYNPTLADVEADSHWLPTVHLADGTAFVGFLNSHPGATGSFTAGQKADGAGDIIAAFSSRGPGDLFLKPDVTAPGVQILAGDTPFPESTASGPPGEFFQALAGTSMSSPHVAGAAILIAALHPSSTPGQIKSALMTSGTTDVLKEDLTTPADPFDFGAGRINVGDADDVLVTLDETAANYAALGSDPINAVHLNVPSINAPVLPGRITTTRTVRNVTGTTQRFNVVTDAPADSSITVSPARFNLEPGLSRTLTITIETDATLGEQQFGAIELRARSGMTQHLPVAFVHAGGNIGLSQDCAPTTIPKGTTATCEIEATNNSFGDTVVDLDTDTSPGLPIVSVSGAIRVTDRHVQLHDVELAGAQAGIPAVAPGELFGYQPLDAFGVEPIPIGDEEILNLTVPSFSYAGETWSTIGVDSNGYAIVGGGSSEDNNCCDLPTGPDPARPNNVLAPFWTDLDGTGAPGIFAATLSDGVNTWLVLEWRVNVFGTTSNRTFQVWIGVNGTEDITFAYDPAALPAAPSGQDFLVGAENRSGEGAFIAGLPSEDLRVSSSAIVPGESVGYSIQVSGGKPSNGTVRTEMTANGVPGVTIVRDTITVTK
jgi:hypothetical protein